VRKVSKPKYDIVLNTTGKRIAWHRSHRQIPQQELADKLFIKRELLSMIENDTRTPTTQQLVAIADALELTTDYLLCRVHTSSTVPDEIAIHDKLGLTAEAIRQLSWDRARCQKAFDEQKGKKYNSDYYRILKLSTLNFLIVAAKDGGGDDLLYSIAKYLHMPENCRVTIDTDIYRFEDLQRPDTQARRYEHFTDIDFESVIMADIQKKLSKMKPKLLRLEDNEELLKLLDGHEREEAFNNGET